MERQGTHRLRPVPPSIPLPAGRRGVPPLISSEQCDPPTSPPPLLQLAEFVAGLVDWSLLQNDQLWSQWVQLAWERLDK